MACRCDVLVHCKQHRVPRLRLVVQPAMMWRTACYWLLSLMLLSGLPLAANGIGSIPECPRTFECECVEREDHSYNYWSLEIDCSGRNLSRVPNWRVFRKMPITWVDLSNNNLRELRDGDFQTLTFAPGIPGRWIPRLDIDDNPIANIESMAFRGLRTPELYLHISNSHMTSFPSEALLGITNLTDLFFMHSMILDLPNDSFKGMKRLRRLDLSGNRLGSLRPSVFAGLENTLKSVYLEHMALHEFPSAALRRLGRLFELKLSHNYIRELTDDIFRGWATTSQQFKLDLQHNSLTTIAPRAFSRSPLRLEKVYLQHNNISDVMFLEKPCTLTFVIIYGTIDLRHNPMVCCCRLYSILQAGFYDLHGMCATPDYLANLPWNSFDYETRAGSKCQSSDILTWELPCMNSSGASKTSLSLSGCHALSVLVVTCLTLWALLV